MTARWASGLYIGDARPIVRCLIYRPNIQLHRTGGNLFSSLLFGGGTTPMELPNVREVTWSRDVDVDVATCSMELYNTEPLPLGVKVGRDLDQPGYFTYNRGASTVYAAYWGHQVNEWSGMLMPDNVFMTFEGYGFDPEVGPDFDPNLVQTGVWMIDDVDYQANGIIKIEARDIGSLLIDHISFPPVTPFKAGWIDRTKPPHGPVYPDGAYAYPVSFVGENSEPIFNTKPVANTKLNLSPHTSSAAFWTSGAVYGHNLRDAFDADDSSYWLSTGNARPDQGYSFEWVQGKLNNVRLRRVRFKSWKDGHTAYLGVFADGEWKGAQMVPYDPNHPASAPNDSDRPYVVAMRVTSTGWMEFDLGEGIPNATRVRITFGNLRHSGLGQFPYRAGCRRFEAYGTSGELTETETIDIFDQNYQDYTDIVKLFCAWGGFYWPHDATIPRSDGSSEPWDFDRDDPAWTIAGRYGHGRGRVWGDLQASGTAGPAPIPQSVFDKKPLMDGIAYVRDILGFLFHIDETGGVVFKAPNIYRVGNVMRSLSERSGNWTPQVLTIDETRTLIDYNAKLSGRNLRERTFVSGTTGEVGHMAAGWNPNPIGKRRVGGWTDQHFETAEECKVMAEMISLRQLLTYRRGSVTIPGYPGIQIDDQIRIFERVASEGFIHYITGLQSTLNNETGEYAYNITTHWLGERPFKRWAFDPAKLSKETRDFLEGLYG